MDSYPKVCHNSKHNLKFPAPKLPTECKRETFSVSVQGDMTSPAFQRARKLAIVLRKNLSQCFHPVNVRSMTPVEWEEHFFKIKRQHGGQVFALNKPVAVFINGEILGDEREFSDFINERYDVNIWEDYDVMAIKDIRSFIERKNRKHVYLQIAIDNHVIGTLLFQLYSDLLPLTCERFVSLCLSRHHGYRGTPIHRVVPQGWIQGGGWKLKVCKLADEGNFINHDRRGVLSMTKRRRHLKNGAQFLVSLEPQLWMNTLYTAFGQLVAGGHVLDLLEKLPLHYEEPLKDVRITRCGLYDFKELYSQPLIREQQIIAEHLLASVVDITEMAENLVEEMFRAAMKITRDAEFTSGSNLGFLPPPLDLSESSELVLKNERMNKITDLDVDLESNEVKELSPRDEDYNDSDVDTVTGVSSCLCGIPTCEQCWRHPKLPRRYYYGPPLDVLDDGCQPSYLNLKLFLKGMYCEETDLRSYMPPSWTREFTSSELTLSPCAKRSFAHNIFEDIMALTQMNDNERTARKVLDILIGRIYDIMKKRKGY